MKIKTKIVATLGPASSSLETISQLVEAGARVFRLNFSHGDYPFHSSLIQNVRLAGEKLGVDVCILQDLQGLKIRLGNLKEGRVFLNAGDSVTLFEGDYSEAPADMGLPVMMPNFVEWVEPGDLLILRDGQVKLEVAGKTAKRKITARVVWGGEVVSHTGIKVMGGRELPPIFPEKDRRDLEFGLAHGIDIVALSFVRSPADLLLVRSYLEKHATPRFLIAKIEKKEALENLQEILKEADGVMIARGDLGLEIPLSRLPLVQKQVIQQARMLGKPVITATQMMESMIYNPQPTRAEAADAANAILDGTDALMLSAETAIGKYPVEAVRVLASVAEEVEKLLEEEWKTGAGFPPYQRNPASRDTLAHRIPLTDSVTDAISRSAVDIGMQLGAKAIVAPTSSGYTARMISRFRAPLLIGACSPHLAVRRFLSLCWGVSPFPIPDTESTDETISSSILSLQKGGLISEGDLLVVTAGVPSGIAGTTNLLKVHFLADILARGISVGSGWVSGTIGQEFALLDALPSQLDSRFTCVLVREKGSAVLKRAKVMNLMGIFALREFQPLNPGVEVTLNLDTGLVYRGKLPRPTRL